MHIYPVDYMIAITEIDREGVFAIENAQIIQVAQVEFFQIGKGEPLDKTFEYIDCI